MVNEESAGPLTPARTPAPPTEVELHPHISGEEDDTQPPIEAKPPKNPVDPDLHTLSASIFLKEIADWDGKSEEIDRTLIAAFEADSYLKCIPDLWPQDIEPLSYINNLDKVSPYPFQRRHLVHDVSARLLIASQPIQNYENDPYRSWGGRAACMGLSQLPTTLPPR